MITKVLSCALIAFALSVTPVRASTISFDVLSPVAAGSSFDVGVLVNDVFDGRSPTDVLVAFGFDVTVGDDTVFHYDGADVNSSLFDQLFLGIPMVSGFAQNPLGIGPGDFTEPLLLATLHFSALKAGNTTIGVTWDSTDLSQGLVYLDDPYGPIAGSVAVSALAAETPVPEPASLLLFSTGLVGLGARYRRRQKVG